MSEAIPSQSLYSLFEVSTLLVVWDNKSLAIYLIFILQNKVSLQTIELT